MLRLKTALKNRLRDAKKIAVMGIGSELRGDDAAGVVVARQLQMYSKKKKTRRVKVFLGQTAPENLTGEIKKFKPTHLVMIDAVDFHGRPGAVKLIDSRHETGSSFTTHKMPAGIIEDYLCRSIACQTIIVGIQPKSLEFSLNLSCPIKKTVAALSKVMRDVVLVR